MSPREKANTERVNIFFPPDALKKLKEMLDLGLIDQAEYDQKKTDIMNRM